MAAENSASPSQEYITLNKLNICVYIYIFIFFIVTTSWVKVSWILGLKMFINKFSFSKFRQFSLEQHSEIQYIGDTQ